MALLVCTSAEGPLSGLGGWPGRCCRLTFPWWSSIWAALCKQCGPIAGAGRGPACTRQARRGVHPSARCCPAQYPMLTQVFKQGP